MEAAELSILDLALAELPSVPSPHASPTREELRTACFRAVLTEFNPLGFAETMLARDIARRGAQLIRDEHRLEAVENQAEQSLVSVLMPTAEGVAQPGSQLSNIELCAPERLEALARAELRNSNAFFLRLRQLQELQRDRNPGPVTLRDRDPRFASELQCIAYLARRFRLGSQGCRRCGRIATGSWIAVRRCWQCSACNTQTCIRYGTVMSRSHVPLTNWFQAIAIVLCFPTIGAAELAAAIGIRRVPTVRRMRGKIRAAMLADNASPLLAGLDTSYLPGT